MPRSLSLLLLAGLLLAQLLLPAAMQAGQTDPRILDLKNQIVDLKNANPLGISNLYLCSKISSFSQFVPLEGKVIPADGKLLLYYEPENVYTKRLDNRYEFSISQDAIILQGDQEIFRKDKMLQYTLNTRQPTMDLFVQNTLTVGSLPPGDYILMIVLHDEYKNQDVTERIPFTIKGK